jgi:hypothetical protein
LHRKRIELNLVQSPWAYVVLALTFLIDGYLLYMFFTRRAASRRSERALLTPGAPSGPDNRIASDMTEPPYDPLGRLNTDLGYVVAILAIAMLVLAVLPPIRLP